MTETTARTYHTMESLRQMAQTDLRNVNRKELVDINEVEIRKDLSQRERMVDFISQIYQWYLMGVSTNEIARRLEFLEVPRPNEHLNRRLHEGHDTTFNKWHASSVLRILDSQVYIGNLVTGKTRTASYKGIGLHPVDKGEWHIVENAHEAIILKSDFEIVQEKRNRNKEKRNNAMARSEQVRAECRNHFAGMVFCGCCRRSMTFVRQVHKTEEESYFGVF